MEVTLPLKTDPNNPGEYILEFPDDLMKKLDWRAGDVLQWIDNADGSVRLVNQTLDERKQCQST